MESVEDIEQINSKLSKEKPQENTSVDKDFVEIVENNVNNDSETILENIGDINVSKSDTLKRLCNDTNIGVKENDIMDSVLKNLETDNKVLLNSVSESAKKQVEDDSFSETVSLNVDKKVLENNSVDELNQSESKGNETNEETSEGDQKKADNSVTSIDSVKPCVMEQSSEDCFSEKTTVDDSALVVLSKDFQSTEKITEENIGTSNNDEHNKEKCAFKETSEDCSKDTGATAVYTVQSDSETEALAAEKTVFVHVNTENEKEDKMTENSDLPDEEDPIASDNYDNQGEEESNNIEDVEQQGADEELCIIPDTERIISQEEKEAASAITPLRDPAEVVNTDNPDVSIIIESKPIETSETVRDKYVVAPNDDENIHTCVQCCLSRKSKYTATFDSKISYICDDNCLTDFKNNSEEKTVNMEGTLRVKNLTDRDANNMITKVNFIRKCYECSKKMTMNQEGSLSWETMDFCNELCLSRYQKKIGSTCATCRTDVKSNCLGKYCVRFGYDIRQFCSGSCLEEYKKGLKVCSYCQKDMSGARKSGFLAPVGDKGVFKDFCSQHCMEKFDIMSNNKKFLHSKPGQLCSVCLNEKPISIEFNHDGKLNLFCSEPCFVAFKFVNNITPGKCDMCKHYVDNKILEDNCIFYDGAQHSFCSKSCEIIYIIYNRKIVPCSWCKVKKYNFDMIKKSANGQLLMMCSLNCLSLYQVSVNAVNSKKIKCDHCLKILHPLYHLTMSDATIRNFCSYTCVMSFQNQFSKSPITLNESVEDSPVPTGTPKRSRRTTTKPPPDPPVPANVPTIPVITSVQSLAPTNGPSNISTKSSRHKGGSAVLNNTATSNPIKTQIKQQIIVKPKPIPAQRNMGTMCKVITSNKGVNCKSVFTSRDTQTNKIEETKILVPIPIPIYVPCPMAMYSIPYPVPIPFPLPVPIPIFIPTTRNSANGIMKEIKKIQVKIPTDPFEAELLMMAEMVAADKKEDNTDSESGEDEDAGGPEDGFSPETVDTSNAFGEDVLQMALKMATELDEPAVDLEGALTANTITASQTNEGGEETVDDPQPLHNIIERQGLRGRKRGVRGATRNYPTKRGRRSANNPPEMQILEPTQAPPAPEPIEKPDANMCLKFTFGVNAWKQWVTTKNAELEKSSRRFKLFKPEILQLTADELNYSLCLFVKEVRKPNGQEYAPDTIYYLCLGIQQYLFENGRIDNIFCDPYYEKFTDCLDEVARKFSVLYNDSHYIVTRVEEEHLWESKQLGAHSPHVLLSTLVFFNTKHFNLTSVDEHMQLSFSHIMKHWKRNPNQPGSNKTGTRNVLLRFYPPQSALEGNARKKKVYEQQENEENPLRCPVKLYEFYLTKCPESVKTRNDVFYLMPERSCVPDSPVWYSTMPLPKNALEKMLHRVKMVKEINVALLTS